MFSLHLSPRWAPVSKALAGIDPGALLVLALAIVSAVIVIAEMVYR